jgi:dimethylargininase
MTLALVRAVPASFARALAATPPDSPIDVRRAQAEHEAYVAALSWLGLDVVAVATDEQHPDACFIEDTALVAGGIAVLTRPGAASRRDEVHEVARVLAAHIEVVRLPAGTLDGGDCLRLGARVYVGRTARTSDEGIAALAAILAPRGVSVVPVDVPAGVLHLKCVVTKLNEQTILLAEGSLDASTFAPAQVVLVPREEAYAANVVAHGDRALVAEGHPRTRALVEQAGLSTRAVDNRELRKADSALSCLSVLV